MLMPPRIGRNGAAGVTLNPFVVLCDITVSVILCLAVTMVFQAAQAKVPVETSTSVEESLRLFSAGSGPASGRLRPGAAAARPWQVLPGLDTVLVRLQADELFEWSKSEPKPKAVQCFNELIEPLGALLDARQAGNGRILEVQIQGHTSFEPRDNTPDSYGRCYELAQERAERVRQHLVRPDTRLWQHRHLFATAAYAWHRPARREVYLASNRDVSCNRRIDIRILFHNPNLPESEQTVIRPMDEKCEQH